MKETMILAIMALFAGVSILVGIVLFLRRWRGSGNLSMPTGAIAEAEVLVACGRKAEAIALLEGALRANPARRDIAHKLRELKRD